jgi:hypothetical protein
MLWQFMQKTVREGMHAGGKWSHWQIAMTEKGLVGEFWIETKM